MRIPCNTQRLILRDLTRQDVVAIDAIVQRKDFAGYRQFRPGHIEDIQHYIDSAIGGREPDAQTGRRELFRLAITLKDSPHVIIGCCVFAGWNKLSKDGDQIGYFLDPRFQSNGYASEAVACLLQNYFSEYPERPVWATAHPENNSSKKLLLKLGFSEAATKTIDVHGVVEPRVVFRLYKKQFCFSQP